MSYNQRPCPNCGHKETHMPIEYTEDMVCDCSECGYVFVKHPNDIDATELTLANEDLRELIQQWRACEEIDTSYRELESRTYGVCADELEELLDD